jgi:hypothetical protein
MHGRGCAYAADSGERLHGGRSARRAKLVGPLPRPRTMCASSAQGSCWVAAIQIRRFHTSCRWTDQEGGCARRSRLAHALRAAPTLLKLSLPAWLDNGRRGFVASTVTTVIPPALVDTLVGKFGALRTHTLSHLPCQAISERDGTASQRFPLHKQFSPGFPCTSLFTMQHVNRLSFNVPVARVAAET